MYRTGVPHFGPSGRPESMNLDALVRTGDLLKIYEEGLNRWQIVKVVDAANAAVGDALYWKSKIAGTVTPTIGNSSAGELAGFAEVIATAANYYIALRQGGLFSVKCHADLTAARGLQLMGDSGNNRVAPAGNRVRIPLVAVTTTAAGGIITWRNPYTHALRVTRLTIDRTTKSTGAASGDFGVAATVASNDTLLDGLDLAAAEAAADNILNPGTNGLATVSLAADSYVTGTASATTAGMVGFAYIDFIHRGAVNTQVIGVAQAAVSAGKVSTMLDIIPA